MADSSAEPNTEPNAEPESEQVADPCCKEDEDPAKEAISILTADSANKEEQWQVQPFIPQSIKMPHVTCAQTETKPACDSNIQLESQPDVPAEGEDASHPPLLTTTTWNLLKN